MRENINKLVETVTLTELLKLMHLCKTQVGKREVEPE